MLRTLTSELRRARDIIHGGRALAGHIAALVEPKISTVLEEARNLPASWLALFQLGLIAMIDGDRQAAVQAEKELRRERRKETRARQRREEAKSALYRLLLGGRSFLEGALKPGASESLVGLEANLGQVEALVLLRYGAEADEELSRPDFKPEAFVIDGKVTTPGDYASEIREATAALQAAEDDLADQVRMTEQKLKVKDKVLKRLGKGNGCCARLLEELYVLAGEEFHAERLRRSSRPRSSPVSEDDSTLVDQHFEEAPVEDDDLDLELEASLSEAASPESSEGVAPEAG